MEISSIYYFSTFSTLTITDISGIDSVYMPYTMGSVDMLTASTIKCIDLSGVSSIYGIDISGVKDMQQRNISLIVFDNINMYHKNLLRIENENKDIFNSLNLSVLKENLTKWGTLGFPDSYIGYTFILKTSPMYNGKFECSDGIFRSLNDYIPFFLGMPIVKLIDEYQQKLHGIHITLSLNSQPYSLQLHFNRG